MKTHEIFDYLYPVPLPKPCTSSNHKFDLFFYDFVFEE